MSSRSHRTWMRASLQDLGWIEQAGLRSPSVRDMEDLGRLMYRAYIGTIDYQGESLEDSIAEVRRTYAGEYGPFDPEHSSVAERAGQLVSATLVTHWQSRPFVAFTMTDPAFGRQGLGRATLQRSMWLLHQDGESELRLVVTVENEPARRLYESLGFAPEP